MNERLKGELQTVDEINKNAGMLQDIRDGMVEHKEAVELLVSKGVRTFVLDNGTHRSGKGYIRLLEDGIRDMNESIGKS